jgi:hypothetical protein
MSLTNANVRIDEVNIGGTVFSVTVPLMLNRCWLTSLSTAIGPMARQEARRAVSGLELWVILALSHGFEWFARILKVDKVAFPEHRLLSTSLYGDRLPTILQVMPELAHLYPRHAIVVRSLCEAVPDGVIWPFRLVWRIDRPLEEWLPRRDSRRDLQALARLDLITGQYGAAIDDTRLARCLALYRYLYIDTYSVYNADYSAQGLRDLLDAGILTFHTLEAADGTIAAFCAAHDDGETLTLPLVGYDPNRPQSDGLYRAIMAQMAQHAIAHGLKLNLSAGAPHFKRHRGAKAWMEYLLIMDSHLPIWRRMGYRVIGWALRLLEPKIVALASA